ncbi:fructokinase [Rhodobacteraceae bacterium THAF1]|uniref:ROK family transcriptional regulator n=1 Tax=Palleronia sp. THAF1 TaxID=2587842 RepID=UPI000F3F869E|nr:ROK family transcriptional regulator [Palleronia sp. THAF1]QFU07896.1 fructokinase [Palleronia sp. THAF1]VDC25730.1 fructokinase [Rhodobacteraceae bacterium THAF1]
MNKSHLSNGSQDTATALMRGTNQTGVRDHNERLVMSILRRDGALSKAEIARLTGLSAQTVSVIMRELEAEEMLVRGAPRRGKVGQPSVPMSLNPDGAYFHGLLVGRRWVDHVLVDMNGEIRSKTRKSYEKPDFDDVLAFCQTAIDESVQELPEERRSRVQGVGLAIPFGIWEWADAFGAAQEDLMDWRDRDFATELGQMIGTDVIVQNDASAACGAELVFGTSPDLPDLFMHMFIGYFIGGGLVIDNRLYTGPSGNAGAIGSMPVINASGKVAQLLDLASLHGLSSRVIAADKDQSYMFESPLEWGQLEDEVSDWIAELAPALAQAIATTVSLIDVPVVMIDGHLPDTVRHRIVDAVERAMKDTDFAGLERPQIRAGTIGPDARSLGAASLPLAAKFLV